MIKYQEIADAAAAYPDYQTAYAAMSQELVQSEYGEITASGLKIWSAMYPVDYQTLRNGTDTMSQLAFTMLNSDALPLVVRDPMIQYFITLLPITSEGKQGLLDASIEFVKVWPNLKEGHVQNAMQKRAEGKI